MYASVSALDVQCNGVPAVWLSERAIKPPKQVVDVDDTLTADRAWRLALDGAVMVWRGDFQNAKAMLHALGRRVDKHAQRKKNKAVDAPAVLIAQQFHLHRQAQAQRARVLNALLVPVSSNYSIGLRRAPDVTQAFVEAWGHASFEVSGLVSLREVLGLIGASEWRKKGVDVPVLGQRIHPFYGVFSPIRGEYIDLVQAAPLPLTARQGGVAVDVGAGTGVLSAVLARRGVGKVLATEVDERALACARFNMEHLGLVDQVEVLQADLFGGFKADLMVCNPPWLPAKPSAAIERAVYDENSQMLKAFLEGLASHLKPDGEGWLVMSDLAEHLQLRTRVALEQWIAAAGLQVVDRLDTAPKHRKVLDTQDPLHWARVKETTSLWRLKAG